MDGHSWRGSGDPKADDNDKIVLTCQVMGILHSFRYCVIPILWMRKWRLRKAKPPDEGQKGVELGFVPRSA